MNRTEKQTIVDDLSARLKSARTVYVTDFAGLNVAQVTDLRRRLRKAGVEYVVVKNTLAQKALAGSVGEAGDALFTGPVAIAYALNESHDSAGARSALAYSQPVSWHRARRRISRQPQCIESGASNGETD